MKRLSLILMTIPVSVSSVAHATTVGIEGSDRGLPVISGGHGQPFSYGQSLVLLNTNNTLVANPIDVSKLLPVDHMQGYGAIDAPCAVGYLIPGQDGTVYTFDRMAAVPVLQILGFERAKMRDEAPRLTDRAAYLPPLTISNGGIEGSPGAPESSGPPPPSESTPVPLPPAAALGGLALAAAAVKRWMSERLRRKTQPAG